jgi:hypothetical protein
MQLGHLLTRSGLTYLEVSLQRSATIPSASCGIVFHYPGQSVARHSVYMLCPVPI